MLKVFFHFMSHWCKLFMNLNFDEWLKYTLEIPSLLLFMLRAYLTGGISQNICKRLIPNCLPKLNKLSKWLMNSQCKHPKLSLLFAHLLLSLASWQNMSICFSLKSTSELLSKFWASSEPCCCMVSLQYRIVH